MPSGGFILETPRLYLREFVPEDAAALALVISDPETMLYYPAPFDHAGVQEWIARNRRRCAEHGHGLWAMLLKSTGNLIGDCGVVLQLVDGDRELEIGYHLRRDHWGQGYATEAAQACCDWAFANRKTDHLISLIRPANTQSRRVAERLDMTVWKETLRQELRHYVYRIDRYRTDCP